MLAWKTSRYLVATWKLLRDPELCRAELAQAEGIDPELLEGWFHYLTSGERRHPYLQAWEDLRARGGSLEEARQVARDFQALALEIFAEKKLADDKNHVIWRPTNRRSIPQRPSTFPTDSAPMTIATSAS